MIKFIIPVLLVGVISAREAKDGEVPYQASIRTDIRGHICSGAILDKQWIVTSRKCINSVRRGEERYVVLGTNDVTASGTTFPIEDIDYHANYDVALVKVNGTITFNDKIKPVNLPVRHTTPGANMLISGWKRTTDEQQSNNLQLRNVTEISNDACEKLMGPHITPQRICANDNEPYGNGEEFFDDRGCPIVDDDKLAAIVSIPLRNNKPGIHTRVYGDVLIWIIKTKNSFS